MLSSLLPDLKQYELTSPVPSLYHCEQQFSARICVRHAEVLWGREEWKARLRLGLGIRSFFRWHWAISKCRCEESCLRMGATRCACESGKAGTSIFTRP